MEKRLLSRQDAAEFLNCSQQTITNWVKDGIIQGHKIDGRLFVDRDSLLAIVDDVNAIEATKKRISELKEQIALEEEMLNQKRESLNLALNLANASTKNINRNTLLAIVSSYRKLLPEKEHIILKEALLNRDLSSIAENLDIDEERVIKIAERACKRIKYVDVDKILNENESMRRQIEELQKENKNLRNGVVTTPKKNNALLAMRIKDSDFSVRAINIMYSFGLDTIEDLTLIRKEDLMKMRNMGKKTIAEIEDFMSINNLSFRQ